MNNVRVPWLLALSFFFPVLVLLHEDLVFARLHLWVVLDGAARLDQQLVDAPERKRERCYKSFSIVSIVPRDTRMREARVPSAKAKVALADTV